MSRAVFVAGLGFGDEGKGSITDFIVRQTGSKLVCRYNGGAQASHAVVTNDGKDHRFSQFGSGTFAGARTFLSRFMLFNPVTLIPEARHLIEIGVSDPYKLLFIDGDARLTTPFHVAANRIREMARDKSHHGSCGMGIGETVAYALAHADAPVVVDLKDPARLRDKLALLAQRLRGDLKPFYDPSRPEMNAEWDVLEDFDGTMAVFQPYADRVAKYVTIVPSAWLDAELAKDQTIVFEGAQGVLLDENHGFHPHTTWSTTTFEWAERLVRQVKGVETKRVGVLRPYMTRHGAGPFVTEDPSIPVPEGEHNTAGRWQASFRMGHFDAVMARYALDVCGGVDELALTCLDHLPNGGGIKAAWEYLGPDSRVSRLPVNELAPDWAPGPELDEHLAKQEKLGKQLKAMLPVFDETSGLHAFINRVGGELKTPVKILSYGPTASLKVAK
jgi:adenylosuccinate synthase